MCERRRARVEDHETCVRGVWVERRSVRGCVAAGWSGYTIALRLCSCAVCARRHGHGTALMSYMAGPSRCRRSPTGGVMCAHCSLCCAVWRCPCLSSVGEGELLSIVLYILIRFTLFSFLRFTRLRSQSHLSRARGREAPKPNAEREANEERQKSSEKDKS